MPFFVQAIHALRYYPFSDRNALEFTIGSTGCSAHAMQSQAHKADAAKALGVILRGIELFGKDQSFLPCQVLETSRESVDFCSASS